MPGHPSVEEEEGPENGFEEVPYQTPDPSGHLNDVTSYPAYDVNSDPHAYNSGSSRNGTDTSSTESCQFENNNTTSHFEKSAEFYPYCYAMSCQHSHDDEHGQSGSEQAYVGAQGAFDSNHHHQTQPRGKATKRKRIITFDQRKAANIRERRRMMSLNDAFDILRRSLPTFSYEKKLSRIETLRLALTYIAFMADVLNGVSPKDVKLLPLKASVLGRQEEQEGPGYPYYM